MSSRNPNKSTTANSRSTAKKRENWNVIFASDLITPENPIDLKWLAEVIDTGSWVKCVDGGINFKLLDPRDEWVVEQLVNLFRAHLYPDTPCYKSVFQKPAEQTPPKPSSSTSSSSSSTTASSVVRSVMISNYRTRKELIEWAINEGLLPKDTNAQEEADRLEREQLEKRKAKNNLNILGGGKGSAWIAKAAKSIVDAGGVGATSPFTTTASADIQGCSSWFRRPKRHDDDKYIFICISFIKINKLVIN